MDASEYDQGRGRVRVRARIEPRGDKKVVIRELPYGVTTESLIASIEAASQKGRVKISGIDDFTTDHVEIELQLARGVYADEVIPQLYAYTECEVGIVSSPVVIRDDHPVELPVPEILRSLTERLRAQLKAEAEWELARLQDRQHWLTLERIFIEHKVYKKLETARSEERVRQAVWDGMAPHREQFVRDMTEDDVRRLLDIRIRRISAYDVEKSREELEGIESDIRGVRGKLRDMKRTTIAYLEDLIARHGERYPRRTQVTTFEEIDKKAVARENLRLSYDPESSYFGTEVRGSEFQMNVTEYARILAISSDGTYRVMAPPRREFLPRTVLHCAPFDPEAGAKFTVVYRDGARIAFAKKIWIQRFVTGKEYRLVKDPEGRIDLLLRPGEPHGRLELHFAPRKGQRIRETTFDLDQLEESAGVSARGTRLAAKPVARVKLRPEGR
jgi:topoisomerase-4 subunit A